jgi:hypothetical protein
VLAILQNSSAHDNSNSSISEQASTRAHDSTCTIDDDNISDDDEQADIIDEKKATARTALELQCDEMLKILTCANLLLPRRDIKVICCDIMLISSSICLYTYSIYSISLPHHTVLSANKYII